MFKLQAPETFHATVHVPEPGGTSQVLEVDFKWLSRDQFIAYCKDPAERGDPQFFAGLISAWDADAPCDEAGMARLFGFWPKASRALFEAYRHELLEFEEKN